jgi:galactoside O-acetyltransferase
METSYYSPEELQTLGLKKIGNKVLISRKSSIYSPGTISIGNNVRIDDYSVISGGKGIDIGDYIHIACFCALYGGAGIRMQDFSTISARVTLYSVSDDYSGVSLTNPMIPDRFKPKFNAGPVDIGRHVLVGVNSTIFPGVTIGEGAAIGAHSLVTGNCDAWYIYFGTPARKIKQRERNLLALEKQFLREIHSASRSF